MSMIPGRVVIRSGAVATVDGAGTEYPDGHLVLDGGVIVAVGPGPAPVPAGGHPAGTRLVDASGCLVTPGLVNTHHHFGQWLTRGRAQQGTLFEWLVELYPVWAGITAELQHAAAGGALTALALSGGSTAGGPNHLFPPGARGPLGARVG